MLKFGDPIPSTEEIQQWLTSSAGVREVKGVRLEVDQRKKQEVLVVDLTLVIGRHTYPISVKVWHSESIEPKPYSWACSHHAPVPKGATGQPSYNYSQTVPEALVDAIDGFRSILRWEERSRSNDSPISPNDLVPNPSY